MTASSSLLLLLLTVAAAGVRSSQGATCDENEFRCKDGFCVDSFLICDGEKHCRDGSDETKDICSKTQISCQPFAFRCGYGACIDGEKKCDGKQDCADNSDENNSDCSPGTDARPPSSTAPSCQLGFFQCESGQCISEYSVCDGTVNCRDGSDETDTLCVNFPCPEVVGFQCTYGGCINKLSQCNGIKDCRDGSDEDNCSPFSSSSALRPNSSSAPTLTPTLERAVVGCLVKQWKKLHTSYVKSVINSTKMVAPDEFAKTKTFWHTVHSLEKCFSVKNTASFWEETADDVYGKYVSVRLQPFDEAEKLDIKHRIDKMLYFEYKKKISQSSAKRKNDD